MPNIPGTAEVIIKGVSSRMVKNGTLKLFEVETAEGTKWTTFREPLARAAHALVNKPALISYKISSNGEFTNYQLNEIGPAAPGGEFAAATPDFAAPTTPPPAPQQDISFQEFANIEQERREAEQKRQASIHRQTATKVAAELSKDGAEFWSNVKDLYLFYERAIIPATSSVTSNATPFDDTEPSPEDDIPF